MFITAVRNQNGNISYLFQTKKHTAEIVSSEDARKFWPKLVADFLESNVEWRTSSPPLGRRFGFDNIQHEVVIDDEPPNRISCKIIYLSLLIYFIYLFILVLFILDVTKHFGTVFYLVNFDNGVRFFKSKEVRNRWPNLIIGYLEPLIQY